MTTSPVQRMKECLNVLAKSDSEGQNEDIIEEKIKSLEELIDWCEDLDIAIGIN